MDYLNLILSLVVGCELSMAGCYLARLEEGKEFKGFWILASPPFLNIYIGPKKKTFEGDWLLV
jgi:hypothetical protein